jgi:uncharacterized membrane protein YhhN
MALPLLGLFWVALALDLLALTLQPDPWHWVAKPLLMPLLLAYAAGVGDRRDILLRVVLVALGAAWLADIALLMSGTAWFLAGVALFGVTQACYLWAFIRLGAVKALRRRRWVMVLMGLVWLAALAVLGPLLGVLALPVAAYGLLLVAMATLAMGVNPLVAIGGALFVVSDIMVGAGVAQLSFPLRGQAVMATYALAQFLIVLGVLRARAVTRHPSAWPPATRRW